MVIKQCLSQAWCHRKNNDTRHFHSVRRTVYKKRNPAGDRGSVLFKFFQHWKHAVRKHPYGLNECFFFVALSKISGNNLNSKRLMPSQTAADDVTCWPLSYLFCYFIAGRCTFPIPPTAQRPIDNSRVRKKKNVFFFHSSETIKCKCEVGSRAKVLSQSAVIQNVV